jgi:RHH-type proline utilization regulon transcriptional repressor/proline dehydrogenase/delta 1-pyrroline-5-carboxylate dehydrogenase
MAVAESPRVDCSTDALERRTRQIGRVLFDRLGSGPRIWQRGWWDDALMQVSMGDDATKVQLFRFIDALPTLANDPAVRRHLDEYLDEAGAGVPWLVSLPLRLAPPGKLGDRVIAWAARFGATRMGQRFIAGSNPQEALKTILDLRRRSLAFTADLLGEAVISEAECDAYAATCLDILRGVAPELAKQPEIVQIDHDDRGALPRTNLSLKLSSLTPRFDALHQPKTGERVLERLRPILREAQRLGAYIHVDMEQYSVKDLTYEIFKQVLMEPEFRAWPDVGIVCQAYLPDALGDLQMLREWAARRGSPITIRLVKGAYWDYEVTHARQQNWPVPVFQEKWQSDAQFERCARFLMEHHRWLVPALASHNLRSLAHGLAAAELMGVDPRAFECQVLYGMGEQIAEVLAERGARVRVYTPYGAMLPGMAYLVRRLLENTSNESFLRTSASGEVLVDDLMRNPEEVGKMRASRRRAASHNGHPGPVPAFRNEPLTDLTQPAAREAMRQALQDVRGRLPIELPLAIGGQELRCTSWLDNTDPSDASRRVSRTHRATANHADQALNAARQAFPAWAATPPRERAEVLMRAAAIMRRRKFELSAWEVFECGKPWHEADADLAEAIDFCEYYAREMIRLAQPDDRNVPGETNALDYIPRGVAVVIPPWNFPLAIPCGMTAAALVAGNAVVLKPAEQSPVMAWHLFKVLEEAGLPPGVLNFVPGVGEEVGAALVNDPRVNLIVFTGSRPVGLLINRQAAETPKGQAHVKRVIAEMGGKNAVIVDDDADLDEAVQGVLYSAFGYAGQKCSACSRAIVLTPIYDRFVERLVESARAHPVGPAEDPDTSIPPVIDAEAKRRIVEYQQLGKTEGRVVLAPELPGNLPAGNYVAPMIVADVRPEARIAQEEIFGPVLAVLKAADLDDALRIANGTEYALTGGIYSRSPANIDRVRRAFLVGNLYINRPITGAIVNRQPFGGFKLSGIGTKAGGPDYLREFLLPRTITENTMRRGFAPEPEESVAVATSPGF